MKFIRMRRIQGLVAYPPKNFCEWLGLLRRGFRKNHNGYWCKSYEKTNQSEVSQ